MRSTHWLYAVVAGALFVPRSGWAADSTSAAPSAQAGDEIDLVAAMDAFETQLEQVVISITKREQRASQAPAVVTVVGADEIQARGYTSLAEVLRTVAGFYDVYDLGTHNVGVRGINGGARASGSVLKLMIDGMPVDYRPTTGNFFGEELIPLAVVERIEIIRGPGSALYGANAYLGVINVITREAAKYTGARAVAQGTMVRANPGGGAGLVMGASGDAGEMLIAGAFAQLDRSGLALPGSSPRLDNATDTLSTRGLSTGDTSRPRSFFGKASLKDVLGGRLSLLASMQGLDAAGEFQDFSPLSHGTRLALFNQNYRLAWERELAEKHGLKLSAQHFRAAPTGADAIDLGRSDYLLRRRVAAQGFGAAAEWRWTVSDLLTLTQGLDWSYEDQLAQSYDQEIRADLRTPDGKQVLRPAGTVLPGVGGEWHALQNAGAFVQGVFTFDESWSAIAGGRADYHTIYALQPSVRAGVVYSPKGKPWHLKLLEGSSFKAPTVEQLYTQPMPMTFLDVKGRDTLDAQSAHTLELAGGWQLPGGLGEVTANGFVTATVGRVEYVQAGDFMQAANAQDDWVVGGELDARLTVHRTVQLRLTASVARTVSSTADAALEGLPAVTNPLFPPYQIHLLANVQLPWMGLRLAPEVSFIGPRESSQSNALELGSAYTQPAYVFTAVALSTAGRKLWGERETNLSLRVNNLLDHRYAEPGFRGADVPALGRTATLTLIQAL